MWLNCQRKMKKEQFIPEEVTIKDNRKAILLVADQAKTQLAIVPMNVLIMIKRHLEFGTVEDIKNTFIGHMQSIKDIPGWLSLLRDEYDFHLSLNMMDAYFAAQEDQEAKETIDQLSKLEKARKTFPHED